MNPEQKPPFNWSNFWAKVKEIAIQCLVIIAAVILVVLVAWGIIKVVPAAISSIGSIPSSISSIFKPKESLAITANPQSVETGTPIAFAWKHVSRPAAGTYSISYACAQGLTMKMRNSSGGDQTIPCGKNIPLGDVMSATLIGTSTQNRLIQIPVTVTFTNTATGVAGMSASIPVAISNDSISFESGTSNTSATETPAPVKTTPKPAATAQYGKPDLALTIISTGVVDPISGQFVSQSIVNPGQKAAVRFSVKNIGTRSSGSWTWSAILPNAQAEVYNGPREASLSQGSSVLFTLGFDNLYPGKSLTISIDDALAVSDSNRNNNAAVIPFVASGTGYSYGNYQNNYGYTTPAPTYAPTYPTYPTTYNPFGAADLSVRILDVDGGANYQTGYYTGVARNHTAHVQVSNIGTAASGYWNYSAQLPIPCQNVSYSNYNFGANVACNGNQAVITGVSQQPIAVGASVTLSIVFTSGGTSSPYPTNNCFPYPYNTYNYNSSCGNVYTGNGAFTFVANSNNAFPELRTDNNSATTYVSTY